MKRSILHIVNQSPFEKPCLKQCLDSFSSGDAIIFLENGVYSLLPDHTQAPQLISKKCYAIKADIEARGLAGTQKSSTTLIDFKDFVQLCTEYDLVQSWY